MKNLRKSMNIELLQNHFQHLLNPEDNMVVTGELSLTDMEVLAQAGIEHVINLQPEDELTFDEKSAVEAVGIVYSHIPVRGAEDLKQTVMMAFDKALREHHGKKTLLHCKTGNRVGAAVALRAGWLRGRKIDTCMERGKAYGLTGLEQEVRSRLLVPR